MSEFDVLEAAFADDFIVHAGDENAVELVTSGGPKQFDAIVGRLRTEEVPVIQGSVEKWVHRDVCQVSVRCEPGTIRQNTRLKVARYTTGDASSHDGQLFHVRTLTSVTDAWTTAEVWRELVAKIQRAGTEGN